MIIVKDALRQQSLHQIDKDLTEIKLGYNWAASNNLWPQNIRYGICGTTLSTEIPEFTKLLILNDINNSLPAYNNITLQYYIWTPNSGISFHDDGHHRFGATIYLNKTPWDKNYGGLFVFENEDKETMTAISPTYNSLIVNDKKTRHAVTLVSPLAKENRLTIQIWGD
jgi:Rps23 Pro-64 3,4-dihydroxylase Tpa1-like proline 4-hydroxylase